MNRCDYIKFSILGGTSSTISASYFLLKNGGYENEEEIIFKPNSYLTKCLNEEKKGLWEISNSFFYKKII